MAGPQTPASKILIRDALVVLSKELRSKGQTICYTSGVFDLLHRGHVEYLIEAKKQADYLIVGINSDSSVRSNKGELRPVCEETDRAYLVAALASVDYVFIFSELNNNENVKLLQPSVYVKAGDYSREKLSSASLVEQYGGKVVFVPFSKGYSTSGIIDKIIDAHLGAMSQYQPSAPLEKRPAVFLDRDGTMNEYVEYLGDPDKAKLLPGVIEAVKDFNSLGYRVVMVTNQPGIGVGYFSLEDFYRVNRAILAPIGKAGGKIDKVYFCPHTAAEGCQCRKPNTGMIDRAEKELNLDLSKSFIIGDTTLELEMARRKGLRSILVATGIAGKDGSFSVEPHYRAHSLLDAVKYTKNP